MSNHDFDQRDLATGVLDPTVAAPQNSKVEHFNTLAADFDSPSLDLDKPVGKDDLNHAEIESAFVDPFNNQDEHNPFATEPFQSVEERPRVTAFELEAEETLFMTEEQQPGGLSEHQSPDALNADRMGQASAGEPLNGSSADNLLGIDEKNSVRPWDLTQDIGRQKSSQPAGQPSLQRTEDAVNLHPRNEALVEDTLLRNSTIGVHLAPETAASSAHFDWSDDLGDPEADSNLAETLGRYSTQGSDSTLEDLSTAGKANSSELGSLDGSITKKPEEALAISNTFLNTGPLQVKGQNVDPAPKVSRGWFAAFENASFRTKQLITASATGVISALAVVIVSQISAKAPLQEGSTKFSGFPETALAAIIAGVTGGVTTFALGQVTANQIKRATADLQAQFDAVAQGNLGSKVAVQSHDELGQLAVGFNQMTHTIYRTISEAQRRAEEQEKAKEDLQRQVIRLLDDVEGAARGDLTVRAEVTADVLGAVADSFNLTINSLQKIVRQV
ncbi:MAG TPA: HAMP domain-containing protein, partial [Candidatus Caenarcaniphilales bacterium]